MFDSCDILRQWFCPIGCTNNIVLFPVVFVLSVGSLNCMPGNDSIDFIASFLPSCRLKLFWAVPSASQENFQISLSGGSALWWRIGCHCCGVHSLDFDDLVWVWPQHKPNYQYFVTRTESRRWSLCGNFTFLANANDKLLCIGWARLAVNELKKKKDCFESHPCKDNQTAGKGPGRVCMLFH